MIKHIIAVGFDSNLNEVWLRAKPLQVSSCTSKVLRQIERQKGETGVNA